MDYHETTRKMLAASKAMKEDLPKVYDFLPRNDYYRLKQLLDEAESILAKHQ
ncbi:MAG: hypothetical protein KGH65_03410 [Candidatus Micrarchaeota archaeon]|nr:hypothetical protein [Candidatus Micrarchaeota archaeon]